MSAVVAWLRARRACGGVLVSLLVMMLMPAHAKGQGGHGERRHTASTRRPPPSETRTVGRHVVRPGETLWSIARRHGVEPDTLARVNRLSHAGRVRIGQTLVIPTTAMAPDAQEPPSPAEIVLGPPPDAPTVAFSWPVAAPVGSPFGPRGRTWHGGVDLRAEPGTPIRAAASGMVVGSGWERGYGRVIRIWHHHDFMSVYAHNRENLVAVGEWVERGQLIGTVGSTGRTTAPHLHFEIRLGGRKYDPLYWLPPADGTAVAARPRGTEAER
jgi:murein DD-endopeptidase MepM/ murein hydrolase activator NlpD